MKLALGTVQFGLNYGIANQRGQVPVEEAAAILRQARAAGVDTLDTAIGYGDSEQRLGQAGVADWRVVTKLPAIPGDCPDVTQWVRTAVQGALSRLRVPTLYGLLLHRPQQLLEPDGELIVQALEHLKTEGIVRKTGISIYEPAELDSLADRYRFDLVQSPFSLLDRRLITTGWMERLAAQGTELHVRSIFLQGLLLLPRGHRPARFEPWASTFAAFDGWLARAGLSALQACVRDAVSFPEIARVIVGVDGLRQFTEVLQAADGPAPDVPAAFGPADPDLLNPARWSTLA